MEKIINFLQSYNEILTGAVLVLMSLVLIIFLAGILRQIKRLNRSLGSITENIQAYFDVILQEEEPQQPESSEVQPEPVQSTRKEEENELQAQERMKQEEEVFNAVLQEYFS